MPPAGCQGHRGAGARLGALRFSFGVNAIHGKPRGAGDYSSAYEHAHDNGLLDPTDVAVVRALLRCTTCWATTLTETARRTEADAPCPTRI
jgi:hypothetical protein